MKQDFFRCGTRTYFNLLAVNYETKLVIPPLYTGGIQLTAYDFWTPAFAGVTKNVIS